MIHFPNAKINLGLFITNKRTDGFHNLETLFYPVCINDALEITAAEEDNLTVYQQRWKGAREENLVWKAYQLIKNAFPDKVSPLDIRLIKKIPNGAGLGGGSSDAVSLLLMVREFFDLPVSREDMAQWALSLGSDCPFFLINQPAFAQGRGEHLQTVSLNLSGYNIVVVSSSLYVNTKDAFSGIKPAKPTYDLRTLSELPLNEWRTFVKNDFEETVFLKYPVLEKVKRWLYKQGAHFALMSGSGSSVYGFFPDNQWSRDAERLAQQTIWKQESIKQLIHLSLPDPILNIC